MSRALEKAAIWLAATAVTVNGQAFAQEVGEPLFAADSVEVSSAAQPAFSAAQIEQMVAPIALYPDALLAQVLMAATYPVEVVQADQWLKRNRRLEGEALDDAVAGQSWDPSVKTLVFFPTALERMAQDLTWTQDLGDAFLAQEADVMAAVQRLRRQAQEAGTLSSSSQQIVRTQGSTIVVEPANPTVVYVPTYNPTVVYGSSWVPATTYYTEAYPTWVSFGAGVVAGAVLAAAIDWDHDDHDHHHIWHRGPRYWGPGWVGPRFGAPAWNSYRPTYVRSGDVYVDRSRTVNVEKTVNVQNNVEARQWVHDPAHRRNVAYRDPTVARRFVGTDGRPPAPGGSKPSAAGIAQPPDRGAMRRLDRSQPAMPPSDRATRDALQGDVRERRDRIMRGQPDAQRSGLAPSQGAAHQFQRPNDTGAGPTPAAGDRGRGPKPAGGPDGTAIPSPKPSGRTEGTAEAGPPQDRTPARGQRRGPSQLPQGTGSAQVPPTSAPRDGQRQWQQRPDARQMPQALEPRETQRPAQRQWQQRPMPPSAEPQGVQPGAAPRQWQQRPDARQMPQTAPLDAQAQGQRQWQRSPARSSAELPQGVQRSQAAPPRPAPQSAGQSPPVPQNAAPQRQRADGQAGQQRQRRRDEAAQPSP
jgi:hypothetical protein